MHRAIGRHVALLGMFLSRLQGSLIAFCFLIGCCIWIVSWLFDASAETSIPDFFDSFTSFQFSGEWLRSKVASRLIDFSSAFAIVLAYLQITGRHFDQLIAQFWLRDHVIICGMSSRSEILAADLARTNVSVVVVDLSLRDNMTLKHRQSGVTVIYGDATKQDILIAAGIKRAKSLICLTQQDETNCAILETVRSMISLGKFEPHTELTVHCHIQSLRLRQQLATLELFMRGLSVDETGGETRFRQFSVERCAAVGLLERFPPERNIERGRQIDEVHIVLIGGTALVQDMVLQIAHVCQYWSDLPLSSDKVPGVRVTLVAAKAEEIIAPALNIFPTLHQLVTLQLVGRDVDDLQGLSELEEKFVQHIPTQCFVVQGDAITTLSKAMLFLDRFSHFLKGDGVVAAVLPPQQMPIELAKWNSDKRLQAFNLYSACTANAVIGEFSDSLAKDIHNGYFRQQAGPGFIEGDLADGTAMHSWRNLNEWYRNSNRYQVAHFDIKLRAIGYEKYKLEPGQTDSGDDWKLSEATIESLAEMEHRRWMAFHLLGGWKRGESRNNALKIHPSLKPYAELSEAEKQKDRDTVIGLRDLLASAGYGVRKIDQTNLR